MEEIAEEKELKIEEPFNVNWKILSINIIETNKAELWHRAYHQMSRIVDSMRTTSTFDTKR